MSERGCIYLSALPEAKYWVFRYMFSGKRFDMGLGKFPRISLADARKEANEARLLIQDGINPLEKRNTKELAVVDAKPPRLHLTNLHLNV